jgi:hypothetical protein
MQSMGKKLPQGCAEHGKAEFASGIPQGLAAGGSMKKENTSSRPESESRNNVTICEIDLEQGSPILCTPTGEQWRIASIDADKISFEKLS